MKHLHYLLLFVFSIAFSACGDSVGKVDVNIENFSTATETASDVTTWYSELGVVKAKVTAPKLIRYTNQKELATEFPAGLDVSFFNANKKVTSSLTAKYGIRKEKEQEVIFRDSIVFINVQGEKLETSELYYNEKTEKIKSDKPFTLTTKDNYIKGVGFTANQDFSDYVLDSISGYTRIAPQE